MQAKKIAETPEKRIDTRVRKEKSDQRQFAAGATGVNC
jgi:hypothetical protein